MNPKLFKILACPLCKGELIYDKKTKELICNYDNLAYPIRDGIPIMWATEARKIDTTIN